MVGAGAVGVLAQGSPTPRVVLSLKLAGVVDPFVASYIDRGIDRANGEGDAAEVSDPFGGDLEVYRDTCVELEALIDTAVERIVKEFASGGNQR